MYIFVFFFPRDFSLEMHEPPYYRDYSNARLLVHSVVTSKYFDLAIAAVIGLNVVTMALEFYMMPKVSSNPRWRIYILMTPLDVPRGWKTATIVEYNNLYNKRWFEENHTFLDTMPIDECVGFHMVWVITIIFFLMVIFKNKFRILFKFIFIKYR